MKAIIVAGGQFSISTHVEKKIQQADLILAADKGGEYLVNEGIFPHYLIGDMDSIDPKALDSIKAKNIPVISCSPRKDETDTELCIRFAREKKASEITLIAATGNRFDHFTTNLFLLEPLCESGIHTQIMDAENIIQVLTGKGISRAVLKKYQGETISLAALSKQVTGLTTKGLEYCLEKAVLRRGSSLGVSNTFREDTAEILVESGSLIVFQTKVFNTFT